VFCDECVDFRVDDKQLWIFVVCFADVVAVFDFVSDVLRKYVGPCLLDALGYVEFVGL